jgi:5,10-methenyltetrahydrofolate synthetase
MNTASEITIGLLQFAPQLGDIQTNINKIDDLLVNGAYANLWVLPELASSGYNFSSREEALKTSEELSQSSFAQYLTKKAQKLRAWFVAGINEREGDKLYNSSVLVGPDGVACVYRKLHLFNREKLFFEPGNLGLPVFKTPFGKLGMLVCFDWMFPETWRLLALKGAQIICHPSNLVLPFCQNAVPGYALTNRIFIATANRTGKEHNLEFTGQSVLVNPKGEYLIKTGKNEETTSICNINLTEALDKRMTSMNEAFNDRREDIYSLNELPTNFNLRAEKKKLRKEIRQLKKNYSEEDLKVIGHKIISQLEKLPQFQEAQRIFIYWSLPDEVPTHEFIEKWRREKQFILPRVVGDHLELREYTGVEALKRGDSYNIKEPTGPVVTDFENIDLAVIPGLAFSEKGDRLGRGGGYYDRTLPFLTEAFKTGIAFPFQVIPDIPTDQNDIKLDLIVTVVS